MPLLAWILLFSLVGSVFSILAAGLFLVLPAGFRERAMPHLISFAVGALLGAAFLALLPDAILHNEVDPHGLMLAALLGLLGFFLLEKFVLWRHCHVGTRHAHAVEGAGTGQIGRSPGILVLFGDALHNFVDGVLIAAAFLTDIGLGIATSLAVAAHEVPQELGDFAVLLGSGRSRLRALLLNILSGSTTLLGAVLAYFALGATEGLLPYVLVVAAASFIYIAVADLIPGLHARFEPRAIVEQIVAIGLGVVVIYWAHGVAH
ncbi:ZIP family metal transporter [Thiohalomonas denitrificans]|uniref:Zinc and cadmium transporter n=1 Tax=Thiohalomonas denitrificans TaxID=415747 RepID=A0A1G5PLE6_9GAMM|nr:ZIP family metal transporter [Thiohalomonas denitrificans]SCZ50302.1 zinc and cadmium transporter [Thiohalomonas denitrificans]